MATKSKSSKKNASKKRKAKKPDPRNPPPRRKPPRRRPPKKRPTPWNRRKKGERRRRQFRGTNLENFFESYSRVKLNTNWQNLDGSLKNYATWSDDEKAQLQSTFDLILEGGITNLPESPPILGNLYSIGRGLDPLLAWDYYITFLAQSLAVQIGRWVPWSVYYYDNESLSFLFDSRSLFMANEEKGTYTMGREVLGGSILIPGDPVRIYEFLESNGFIGSSRLDTLERFFAWCTDNLLHYGTAPPGISATQYYWGSDFGVPVERVISGTYRQGDNVKKHWINGCWGATAFLKTVLRTINMPVKLEERCGHALPSFVTEDPNSTSPSFLKKYYLSHGDDLYSSKPSTTFPRIELLIDQDTFDDWFGSSVPGSDICNNVSRRSIELFVQHLSIRVLSKHCDDLESGVEHVDSRVYNYFGLYRIYSVESLESANFWERIEEKIASLGGCENIPRF